MIRISRPTTEPTALAKTNVQKFITESAAHKADPVNNPAPKRPSSYRNTDLLTAFDTYFHAKCYLTEELFGSAWEMDVDHFEPMSHNPGRVLDWTNLYPAAHKANVMRGDQYPPGGLLDPCSATDNVEFDIIYTLVEQGDKPGFHPRDPANAKAVNTAQLLDELHNGKPHNAASNKSTRHLRYLIEKKYKMVREAWGNYWRARALQDEQDIFEAADTLKALLSRKSSFTMLMRSLPFIRKDVPADLLD
jgi:hypothetical protein